MGNFICIWQNIKIINLKGQNNLIFSGNNYKDFKTVPQTDTGWWVENTKAYKVIILKELGKLAL